MRKKVGLFTLGITLVLSGIAIILTRYTDFHLFGDIFLLWPIFLILLGLEFIISKLWYDFRNENVQLSPSGLSIFLALVILFVSSAWIRPGFSLPDFNFNFNGNMTNFYKDTVEDTIKVHFADLSDIQQVVINNARGSVEVLPSDDRQLDLEAQVRINTNNKEEAYHLLQDIITVNQGSVTTITGKNLSTNREHSLQHINMTIRVPKEVEIELSTEFGPVFVKDMENNVSVRQKHSDVTLENIKGNTDIHSSFADINASAITGDLNISNSHGRIKVESVSGSANIENSFASTAAQKIGRDLSINSKHGEVQVDDIKGNASIENQYSSISCSNIEGNLDIRAQHSKIIMSSIKGNIDVETSFDDIRLSNPDYTESEIKASTSFGSIKADDKINLKIDDKRNLQEASVTNGSGSQKIRLKNQHGDIRIDMD
jgi:hypothetical protein